MKHPRGSLLNLAIALAALFDTMSPRYAAANCRHDLLMGPPTLVGGLVGERIRSADFNEDGITDLVVTLGSTVFVQLGLGENGVGNGQFSAPASYPVVGGTGDIAVADLNTDGVLDIAVTCFERVAILLGAGAGGVGSGTFVLTQIIPTGQDTAFNLKVADLNSDGILDLVAQQRRIAVLRGAGTGGTGDGTFVLASTFPVNVGGIAQDTVVEDFDEDGIQDLAVCGPNTIAVYKGQGGSLGDGSFTLLAEIGAAGLPTSATSGDFNADGITDLAMGVGYNDLGRSSGFSIMLGRGTAGVGDGTFDVGVVYPGGALTQWRRTQIVAADFNQDGITDFAVPNDASNDISVFLGLGGGGFGNGTVASVLSFSAGESVSALASGDFNSDGRTDLATGPGLTTLLGRCVDGVGQGPTITGIQDAPNDQGGHVFLTWLPSVLDNPGETSIAEYVVWRRIPGPPSMTGALQVGTVSIRGVTTGGGQIRRRQAQLETTYWEAVTSIPAHFLGGYGHTASTPQDSIAGSNPYTAFFVSAVTFDPLVFFDSEVDSGYSVDNLAPSAPKAIRGVGVEPGVLRLHWRRNVEPDMHHYVIYKGSDPSFLVGPASMIAVTPDTAFTDFQFGVSQFYRVSAVDIHGNESPRPPVVTNVEITGLPTMLAVKTGGAAGLIEFRYTITNRVDRATLEVFDVAGRRVHREELGATAPGAYSLYWNRRARNGVTIARGMYVARLAADARQVSQKFLVAGGGEP